MGARLSDRRRPELVKITDEVVLGVFERGDEGLGLLLGPGIPAARQDKPAAARPRGEGLVRYRFLDVPHVKPVGDIAGKHLVEPPQELDLRHPER